MRAYKILNLILGPSAIVCAVVMFQGPHEEATEAQPRDIASIEPVARISASALRGLRSPQEICQQHEWTCSETSELFIHSMDQNNYPAYRMRMTDSKDAKAQTLIVDASSGLILQVLQDPEFE